MKNIFRISGEILFIFLMFHCRKDNTSSSVLPSVTTTAVTEISYTTAISGGKVTNDGGSPVVSRGVCWNSSFNPTIENTKTVEVSGSGLFTSKINLIRIHFIISGLMRQIVQELFMAIRKILLHL